jgi:hypothetical protein
VTLFAAANVYAPGESGTQGLPGSQGQNMTPQGRYDLSNLQGPNLVVGLLGLLVVAWLAHRYLGIGK